MSSPGLDALDPTPRQIDKSAFFEGAQKTTEVGGTSYGIPWYVETRVLFYRSDLAKKAGYDAAPTDQAGLKDMAKAMQTKAGAKWGIGLQAGGAGSWQTLMPFAWSNGADLTKDGGKAYNFDSPEILEATKYYQSFFTDGISNKAAPATPTTEPDFASGKVPMFISGPWMMSAVEKVGGAGFKDKYNVAPIPAGSAGSSSFVGGSNFVVFKNTKNRDTSWKFVQWLADPKVQAKWYTISTDLPSVKSAWQDPALAVRQEARRLRQAARDRQGPAVVPDVGAGRQGLRHRAGEDHEDRRRPGGCPQDGAAAGRLHRHGPVRTMTAQTHLPSGPGGSGRLSGRREAGGGAGAWILAIPFCLLFLAFTAWPVIQSLFMSFTDTKARDLRNPFAVQHHRPRQLHQGAVRPDLPQGRRSTRPTSSLVGMPLTLLLALAAAVALDKGITRFRAVFRLGFYMPVITSIVAVAVVWRFLLQDPGGLINTVLGWFGIDGPNWLGDPNWSMPALIMMAAWRNFGTAMIIFLAGLQAVPAELHEAAAIDGAGAWKRFRHVTLPLLRPTMLFVMVTTSIGYLQFFEEPFVMTKGGPLNSTMTVSLLHVPPVRLRQLRPRVGDELPHLRRHRDRHGPPVPPAPREDLTMSVDTAPARPAPAARGRRTLRAPAARPAWSARATAAAGGSTSSSPSPSSPSSRRSSGWSSAASRARASCARSRRRGGPRPPRSTTTRSCSASSTSASSSPTRPSSPSS